MAAKKTAVVLETERLLAWFETQAQTNAGLIPPFTNADVIADLREGLLKNEARAHGNIQSRIDFACYKCMLPPLGLTADSAFRKAWSQETRSWPFPKAKMQAAAQTHVWTDHEFDAVLATCQTLPLQAADAWIPELETQSEAVQTWAESFAATTALPRTPAADPTSARIHWSRDELILALELYLAHEGRDLGEKHPEIVALSDFLNQLGAVVGTRGGAKFRNANGVAMKLMNFRRHDPHFKNQEKTGLSGGNKLEGPVWKEYADDPAKLAEVVKSIRATVLNYRGRVELSGDDEADIAEAPEGKVLTRLHRSRERSRKLVEAAKKRALKQWKRLFCLGCNFEFGTKYGPDSAHIIDCHHTKPVSTLPTAGDKTFVDDLVLLCSNCHRVVHSRRPWLSIEQLHERLAAAAA